MKFEEEIINNSIVAIQEISFKPNEIWNGKDISE